MRKTMAFSYKMSATKSNPSRSTFSAESKPDNSPRSEVNTNSGEAQGVVKVFMTKSMIDLQIKEMKKSINIRFNQLIRASKAYMRSVKTPEDVGYLKKFMVIQLTGMLGEYVDMLQANNTLQLQNYLKINATIPTALDSCRTLSKIMIKCNRVRKSSGTLPPKNQHELNRAMNDFMSTVIDTVTSGVNVNDPLIVNESLQE